MGSLCVLFLYIIFEILKIQFEKWYYDPWQSFGEENCDSERVCERERATASLRSWICVSFKLP